MRQDQPHPAQAHEQHRGQAPSGIPFPGDPARGTLLRNGCLDRLKRAAGDEKRTLVFRDGAFPGGDALATPQTYSGMLAGNFVSDWGSAAPDLADWYAFDFTGEQDRVEFRLESARAQDLSMTFYGPRPAGPDSASKFTEWPQEASVWNKKAKCQQLSVEIDSRRHYSGLDGKDTKDTPVRYWLRVTHKDVAVDGNPAIPYALTVGEAL